MSLSIVYRKGFYFLGAFTNPNQSIQISWSVIHLSCERQLDKSLASWKKSSAPQVVYISVGLSICLTVPSICNIWVFPACPQVRRTRVWISNFVEKNPDDFLEVEMHLIVFVVALFYKCIYYTYTVQRGREGSREGRGDMQQQLWAVFQLTILPIYATDPSPLIHHNVKPCFLNSCFFDFVCIYSLCPSHIPTPGVEGSKGTRAAADGRGGVSWRREEGGPLWHAVWRVPGFVPPRGSGDPVPGERV